MARTKGSITRCGYCYEEGHNRRTCPDLKKVIKNNPDGRSAQRAARMKARQKTRRCSYCDMTGHNLRTCPAAQNDKTEYTVVNWEFQQAVGHSLDKLGLGVGSMISREAWSEKSYWLITGINWSRLNIANWYMDGMGNEDCAGSGQIFETKRIDVGSLSEYDRTKSYNLEKSFKLPEEVFTSADLPKGCSTEYNVEVVGPVADQGGSHLLMGRDTGLDFMRHVDYKGRAERYMKKIVKKWNSRHDK